MTAAQFEDQEGRDLVEAIHRRKAAADFFTEECPWDSRHHEAYPSYVPEKGFYVVCRKCGHEQSQKFDYNEPLPPAPNYRGREWEPTTDKEHQ